MVGCGIGLPASFSFLTVGREVGRYERGEKGQ